MDLVLLEVFLTTLVTAAIAVLGWSVHLAYQAGRCLANVEQRLSGHEKRISWLERWAAWKGKEPCQSSTAAM